MSLSLLQISDLQIGFRSEIGTSMAVHDFSLEVKRGEIVAVVGESGSGKSVTSLSILQLLPKSAFYPKGTIHFSPDGETLIDLLHQTDDQLRAIRGNQIAMIFQEPMTALNPVFTCGDQVMEAIRAHHRVSITVAKEKTIDLFKQVMLPSPEELFHRYPHQLSGGQKQRVMIAMAMSCEPALLICDEPTTALDVTVQKTILQLIRSLQQRSNMGVIFITHDLGVVAEVADKAVVMYKGRIVEQGMVRDIFQNPVHPYTKGLLACRPILHPKGKRLPVVSDFLTGEQTTETGAVSSSLHGDEAGITQQKEMADARTVHVVKDNDLNRSLLFANKEDNTPAPREILVKAEQLSVWFPSRKNLFGKPRSFVKAVNDVSFEVYKGETLGLVGESGCGKTTLGRTLLRLIEPTAGKIQYKGIDLTAQKKESLKSLRKEIQIIFQDPYSSLNPRLTIGTAITEPMKVHGILNSAKARRDKAIELLEKVNLQAALLNRYPHEFSGGQRQRIVIARALALNPDFVVCDESVSALDVSVQAQVLNLLQDLKKEYGFTVIFISHDLSVVRYISDRIMVMNKGQIEEIGDAEQVYAHPVQKYTQQLIAAIPKGLQV